MQTLTLELPAMYGDHHVIEVRRTLLGVSGIKNLYASSYLRTIELSYDPEQVTPSELEALLAQAGYTVGPEKPAVVDPPDPLEVEKRQTALDIPSVEAINFVQHVPVLDGGAWPCPGLGVVISNGKET